MPIDNQLLRAGVGIYNFRRPFIKLKFLKSQSKCPTTSTLFTTSLTLLQYNKETLLNQANECTKLITETKQNYIAKMSSKLDCPDTASKTYWSIINRFLNKKKDTKYTASPC